MKSERDNPNARSEHERRNEGGREFGHVHEPTQARMASTNKGLAEDRTMDSRHQQQAPAHQEGSGTQHSSSERESNRGSGSQQGRPPGNASRERGHDRDKRSAV